jgi:hypothetical protein
MLRHATLRLVLSLSLLSLAPSVADAGRAQPRRAATAGAAKARPAASETPASTADGSGLARARSKPGRTGERRVEDPARAEAQAQRAERALRTKAINRMRRTLARADHRGGIRQITGKNLRLGQTRFGTRMPADPFVDVLPDGRVHVYGTFENYLEFRSLDDMLRGASFTARPIPTREYLANEASWDHLIHRFDDGTEVMYAGMMSPTEGRTTPAWPADNWNRRIFAMTRDKSGQWVKHDKPLFGAVEPGTQPTMLGHAYGHHFRTVKKKVGGKLTTETWLYHEEVVSEGPLRTEIFARKMIDPFTASDQKVKIVGVDPLRAPELGKRENGEYLVEGPRPFDVMIDGEPFSFVAFSSGDFNSDNYDMNFAWKKGLEVGEHRPMLDPTSRTPKLAGFGQALKQKYELSWLGRAHVVEDARGDHWAVFHAVDKRVRPDIDYRKGSGPLNEFQRNIYAVPLRFSRGPDGAPRVEVLDEPRAELTLERAVGE